MVIFLRAKHWQLFSAFFGLYILNEIFSNRFFNLLIGGLAYGIILAWYWTIGVVLNDSFEFTLSNRSFKVSFYAFITLWVVFLVSNPTREYMNNHMSWVVAINILIILLLMYCILFCARTIRTIELKGRADASDCLGHFFLLFFFPIGIWYLQPRINGMVSGSFYESLKANKEIQKAPDPILRKRINYLIGVGILVFLAGHFLGLFANSVFKGLIPMGFISAIIGSILFLSKTNLKIEFQNSDNLEPFQYFLDKILLKSWMIMLLIWMGIETSLVAMHKF